MNKSSTARSGFSGPVRTRRPQKECFLPKEEVQERKCGVPAKHISPDCSGYPGRSSKAEMTKGSAHSCGSKECLRHVSQPRGLNLQQGQVTARWKVHARAHLQNPQVKQMGGGTDALQICTVCRRVFQIPRRDLVNVSSMMRCSTWNSPTLPVSKKSPNQRR